MSKNLKRTNLTMSFVIFLSSLCIAQLTLSGTSYTQSFDTIGSGLPTGWTVRTGATSSSLGTTDTLVTSKVTWGTNTGQFANCASADNLTSSSSTTEQNTSSDRVISVQQTGAFGDPGAAFTLQIANTLSKYGFNLKVKHQTLDTAERTTIFSIQYSSSAGGSSWSTLGTYSTGTWGTTNGDYNLLSSFDNVSNTVWIRIVTLSASTGANFRDRYAIDDFELSWSNSPLPVELVSFKFISTLNAIHLHWQTASELNNDIFLVERSQDGKQFTTIGEIPGNGTTTSTKSYSFADKSPATGYNYYRLKQVDYDGAFTYSKVISAWFGAASAFKVFPTQVGYEINISIPDKSSENVRAEVYDQLGRLHKSWLLYPDQSTHTLDASSLQKGLYILRLQTEGVQQAVRFVKM